MSDPFEQIGPKLRQAREAAGLEIAEAARRSQVPRRAAEAFEEENFSYFDSQVYAKSFLLQYSGFLGVDAQTWLDALEPGSFMAGGAILKGPEPPTRRAQSEEPHAKGAARAVIVLLLVVAAIVYGVMWGFEFFEPQQGDLAPPAQESVQEPLAVPGTEQPKGGGVR